MTSQMKILADGLLENKAGSASETCDIFQQVVSVGSPAFWQLLRSVRSNSATLGFSISVTDSELLDEHDLLDETIEDFADRKFFVRIVKNESTKVLKFFTVDGFDNSLRAEPNRFESGLEIVIAALAEDFNCQGSGVKVGPWADDWIASPPTDKDDPSPRRIVNDMSGKALLPMSPRVWIVSESSDPWWMNRVETIGIKRLAMCLPDAISMDADGIASAHVRSGRKVAAAIDPTVTFSSAFYLLLSEVNKWIYLEGPDAETRHSLLASELVRLWPSNAEWLHGLNETLEGSFEAARTAYRLHLQSKGVDALKLMSDLRKGLSDDVRSLASNTASLSSGLWRDAAVAFGVVVLKATTATIGSTIIWFTIAYLIASCAFTVFAASSAVNAISENEKSFRNRLYAPLLLEKDYEELAGKHYRKALDNFEWYRLFIILAYVVAIVGLAWFSRSSINGNELLHLINSYARI